MVCGKLSLSWDFLKHQQQQRQQQQQHSKAVSNSLVIGQWLCYWQLWSQAFSLCPRSHSDYRTVSHYKHCLWMTKMVTTKVNKSKQK
jgi:hypothetical protein